jgi:hypothetical protein
MTGISVAPRAVIADGALAGITLLPGVLGQPRHPGRR